jgi:hypothetical protein
MMMNIQTPQFGCQAGSLTLRVIIIIKCLTLRVSPWYLELGGIKTHWARQAAINMQHTTADSSLMLGAAEYRFGIVALSLQLNSPENDAAAAGYARLHSVHAKAGL